jgi:hypothetical protein
LFTKSSGASCTLALSVMDRSLPIYASTASRRGRGRGWSRRRRGWLRILRPGLFAMLIALLALGATAAERALG